MSEISEADLEDDVLFLACTRPAMIWGVPLEGLLIALSIGMAIFLIWTALVTALLVFGASLWLLRQITAWDHNFFSILRVWYQTKGKALNAGTWGGVSLTPLPLARPRKAKEMRRV